MFGRAGRNVVVALVAAGTLVGPAVSASAAGPGTWTKITTPSGTTTLKWSATHNHFTVSGRTSPDVTSVDIVCILDSDVGPVTSQEPLATDVPVAGGDFSTIAVVSQPMVQCRLRAVPSGIDPSSIYLGSFSGPILYMSGILYSVSGSTRYGFTALDEQGDGFAALLDAGECGPALSATIEPPAMFLHGTAQGEECAFALPGSNPVTMGSAVTVDGHNAYLPAAIHQLNLGLPQPALTVSFAWLSHGNVRVTESAPLKRCSVDDTWPPTNASCPALAGTGVTFSRVSDLFRGAHQIRVRDTFTSTDGHAHSVKTQYEGGVSEGPQTGAIGYRFPGGSTKFHRSSLSEVVTGLGSKAGTMFVRSDMYAGSDDPLAATLALTWSSAPQRVQFSGAERDLYAMRYGLTVPAHRQANLGFAYTILDTTSAAAKLAGVALHEMVNAPVIGSPNNGAVIHGKTTTVQGSVTAGANGLPTAVKVNGHAAHLTRVSTTKATYRVSFSESLGKHTLTVTATDSAGNAKSRSVRVKNV